MTDSSHQQQYKDEKNPQIAQGVDEEATESNRRILAGRTYVSITAFATLYAAFHMAALNGVSISSLTGIDIPFLPQFPLETWNFRIVHIAGALGLGFLLFSAQNFTNTGISQRKHVMISAVATLLTIPALISSFSGISFAIAITYGNLPQMGGLTTWAAFPGPEIYTSAIQWLRFPRLIAPLGAIFLGWLARRGRSQIAFSDIVLAICGLSVAVYLISIHSAALATDHAPPHITPPCTL